MECMVLLPDEFMSRIMAFDNGHATPAASASFYSRIKNNLLSELHDNY